MLKLISTKELNIEINCINGFKKIQKLSFFNKFFICFWLLGPFIYLIERDPADFWLTLLSLVFLFRCFLVKDWLWAKQWWFKFTIIFWLYCIFKLFF